MSREATLPRGWAEVPIRNLIVPSGTRNPRAEGEGTFRYVDVDALDNQRQMIASPKLLKKSEAPSRARMLIKSGDVIFCLVRPYLKNIAVVPSELDGEIASTAYSVLRLAAGVESRFLFYQLVRESFIHSIPTYGSSPPSARDEEFEAMTVRLAPTVEQRRIVARIEELFSELDAGVAALERVKANLKRYRAAVLKAAVEGKLTEQWRKGNESSEPADKLLARILEERRKHWEKVQLRKSADAGKSLPKEWRERYKVPKPVTEMTLPSLPEGWAWATFDQSSYEVTVGHVGPMKDRYIREGISFLRSQNVRPLRYDPAGLEHIPLGFDNALVKSRLYGGELLVVRSGVNVGDACVLPMHLGKANCADLVITRPCPSFRAAYGAIYINSPVGRAALHLRRTGNAQPHFNIGAMEQTPFPFPPTKEQDQIVAEVERRLSVADVIEADIGNELKRAARLRQAILKRAFAGKLVAQDSGEESALILLERMGKQQEGESKSSKISSTRRRTRTQNGTGKELLDAHP